MLCVTMEMQYSFSSDKIHNHISSIIPLAQPINLYHNIMQECSISLHRSYDEITQCRSAQPISYITDWRVTLTGYSPSSTWQSLNVPIRRSRSLMIHDRQAGEHANWWTWKSQRPSLFPAGSVAVWLSEGGDASVGSPPLILLLLVSRAHQTYTPGNVWASTTDESPTSLLLYPVESQSSHHGQYCQPVSSHVSLTCNLRHQGITGHWMDIQQFVCQFSTFWMLRK